MSTETIILATQFVAISAAFVGGVFLAFSDFIMRALVSVSPVSGIAAMQAINVTVLRSIFLATFLGLGPITLVLVYLVATDVSVDGGARVAVVTASVVYWITAIAVTIVGNVPMNERLARLEATAAEAQAYWQHYGVRWTRLNHGRTLGCLLTAAGFSLASIWL